LFEVASSSFFCGTHYGYFTWTFRLVTTGSRHQIANSRYWVTVKALKQSFDVTSHLLGVHSKTGSVSVNLNILVTDKVVQGRGQTCHET